MSQMIKDQCCLYGLHLEKKAAEIQGKQPCASIYLFLFLHYCLSVCLMSHGSQLRLSYIPCTRVLEQDRWNRFLWLKSYFVTTWLFLLALLRNTNVEYMDFICVKCKFPIFMENSIYSIKHDMGKQINIWGVPKIIHQHCFYYYYYLI